MANRAQIGDLLVEAGIISVKTLERALEMQKGNRKRLGAILNDLGLVSEEEVMEALAKQCHIRTIKNFANYSFSKELLGRIPPRLALEKLIFPLKEHDGMLALATLDPFDRATFDQVAEQTGMRIHLALATKTDILAAIRKHYLVGKWATGGRKKILVIDSSPVVTGLLEPPLQREGYEVFLSHDGIDGLKVAFTRQPDMILCDVAMPRMDGYTFMHAVRAHPETRDIPVILMTTRVSGEEEHRALKAGFIEVITKPVMPIRAIVTVKKALAIAESRRNRMEEKPLPPPSSPTRAPGRGRRREQTAG